MKIVTAIIETPKGSTEKYDYDPKMKLFILKKMLPAGMAFPYDFGFIPDTLGEDGDALDIIVISEFQTFPGCAIECRLLGAMLAEQTGSKKTIRNDRYIAVPNCATLFKKIKSISDLPEEIITELEDFFINYNQIEKRKFKLLKQINGNQAAKLIDKNKHQLKK